MLARVVVTFTAWQRATHVPAEQRGRAPPQETKHEPQNWLAILVSTSQPSPGTPLQLANPFSHGPIAQAPSMQRAPACA